MVMTPLILYIIKFVSPEAENAEYYISLFLGM